MRVALEILSKKSQKENKIKYRIDSVYKILDYIVITVVKGGNSLNFCIEIEDLLKAPSLISFFLVCVLFLHRRLVTSPHSFTALFPSCRLILLPRTFGFLVENRGLQTRLA